MYIIRQNKKEAIKFYYYNRLFCVAVYLVIVVVWTFVLLLM